MHHAHLDSALFLGLQSKGFRVIHSERGEGVTGGGMLILLGL
jgi:hypothetical protein